MDGLIRKIIIGRDPKDAMAYYVGMRAGGGEVSTIIMDDEHLFYRQQEEIPRIFAERRGTGFVEVCRRHALHY